MTPETCVDVVDVTRRFRTAHRDEVVAVDHISLRVGAHHRIGIVGESGSGKSTLVRMLLGLDHPSSGEVLFRQDLSLRRLSRDQLRQFRREVQLVPQDTSSSFDPLRELRTSVRRPAQVLLGMSRKEADEATDRILASLSIDPDLADRRPHQISGGQRQRFAIARTLIVKPKLVVCDEAVSALDVSVQGTVLNELKRYCETEGAGLVFVSHALPAAAFIADELVIMNNGRIVEQGRTSEVIDRPQHPYAAQLIEAYRVLSGEQRIVS